MQAERGYLITATNTATVDYVDCAYNLIKSIRQFHPDAKICLLTDQPDANWPALIDYYQTFNSPLSDNPYANDWQVFGASPFRQTIKLEADMVIASEIDHWWDMLQHRDIVVSTGARDFYDQPAESRFYRKVFDANHLPDVYNAITYWRLSRTAQDFFATVRDIFENWPQYRAMLKFPEAAPSTDVVYAIAATIVGPETCTLPFASYPTIIHMKRHIIAAKRDPWVDEMICEYRDYELRVNTVVQRGAFHYNVKNWHHER